VTAQTPSDRPVGAWPRLAGLRRWSTRHPLLTDAAFMFVPLLLVGGRANIRQDWVLSYVIVVLLFVPLIWRRRYPLPVFAFLCAVAAAQWTIGSILAADLALLIGLYTVAAHCPRRHALLAAGVLEVGVALAVLRWVPLSIWFEAFVMLSGMAVAAFVLGVNIRTRRDYLASLEDRAVRAERERDQQSQIAAAGERARIAREMHDIVAHNLSVMIALADGAAFAARSGSPQAESAARQVSATGRQALTEMHRLLGVLRDGSGSDGASRAPQPGIEQLDELVAHVRSAGPATALTVTGRPFALPPTAQLAVYRVAQEALTNVLKHAEEPTEVRVRLTYDEPVVRLDVTDDGRAPAAPRRGAPTGHGLTGMRERAAVFDGDLTAGPRPNGGWRVSLRLDTGANEGAGTTAATSGDAAESVVVS
jgi:signal transduction histidine kinase